MSKVYLDRKNGRLIDESIIKFEFEMWINEPWFRMSFQSFCEKNFELVKEGDLIVMMKTYGKVHSHAA